MEIIQGTKEFHIDFPTAVSIGKFDGVHMGHRLILSAILEKKAQGMKACIFTFSPAPEVFFGREDKCITTVAEKRALFESLGIDYLVEYPFDQETADMDPSDFIREVLVERMNTKFIAAGDDLSYGKGGKGDSTLLKSLEKTYGYTTQIVDKVKIGDVVVSSTVVRDAVKRGDMELVRDCLGEPYHINGTIVHGAKVGRTIGIPTINQIPEEEKLLPPFGVYFSETVIDGKTYKGISNIGVKPTVSDVKRPSVETFLYNFNQDVYGNEARVMLYGFSRPEMKFKDLNELKAQMKADVEKGLKYNPHR